MILTILTCDGCEEEITRMRPVGDNNSPRIMRERSGVMFLTVQGPMNEEPWYFHSWGCIAKKAENVEEITARIDERIPRGVMIDHTTGPHDVGFHGRFEPEMENRECQDRERELSPHEKIHGSYPTSTGPDRRDVG